MNSASHPPPDDDTPIDALIRAGFRQEDQEDAPAMRRLAERIKQATSIHLASPHAKGRVDDPARLLSSDDFERYAIAGEIGRGGVGEVLRGRDRTLERNVAIKVLSEKHANRPDMINRFIEEAQIGGQLQHPGIVPVHDVGYRDDGRPFFTMKLVEGSTLAELLQSRPDPTSERRRFLTTFEKICQTVAFAHARGVVHRDLKPANIMVGAYGEVQVMDWGMAKVLDRKPTPTAPTEVTTVRTHATEAASETGSVMGTPAYMPPEQALGEVETIDARADVFALGAILCEILTGAPPYVGSPEEIRRKAGAADLADARARLELVPLDAPLRDLAFDMLSRAKTERPADAGVVADRFNHYRSAIDEKARTAEVRAARARARFIVASVAAAAGVIIAALLLWRQHENDQRTHRVEREVDHAIDDLTRTLGEARAADRAEPDAWPDVESAAKRLGSLARATDVSATTGARAQALVERALHEVRRVRREHVVRMKDRETVRRFESIIASKDPFDRASQRAALERAYREYGIDVDVPGDAARKIDESAIRSELVRYLYMWFVASMDTASGRHRRLLEILDATDDDPLRRRLRQLIAARDGDGFRRVADKVDVANAPLVTIHILAICFTGLGDPAGGVELLRRGLERHPGDPWLIARLARFLEIAEPDAKDEAYRCYYAVRAMRPESADAWVGTARWKLSNGDPVGAEHDARRAIALNAKHAGARRKLADVLFETHRKDEAIEVARSSLSLETDAFIHNWFAGMLHGNGDDGVEEHLLAAVRLQPSHVPSWHRLATWRQERGDRAGSLDAYRAILRIGDRKTLLRPDVHRIHRSMGYDPRRAVAEAHFQVGDALRGEGHVAPAVEHLREAARRDRNPLIRGKLGMMYLHLDRLDDAIRSSRELIAERPDFPLAHMTLAQALERSGQYDEALASYRDAADACRQRRMRFPDALLEYARTKARHARSAAGLPIRGERRGGHAAIVRRAVIHDDHGFAAAAAADWAFAIDRYRAGFSAEHLSRAAAAAIRYATSSGKDAPDEAARRRWFERGLDWLTESVERYRKEMASPAGPGSTTRYQLGCIRSRRDFRALREGSERLPDDLAEKAKALWGKIDAALGRA